MELLNRKGDGMAGGGVDRRGAAGKQPAPCASAVDVARLDAGELSDLGRAAIKAHVRGCWRCESSLAEIRRARRELLGDTPGTRVSLSIVAAVDIQRIVRLRRLQGSLVGRTV